MGSMSTKAKVIAIIVAVVVIMVGTIIGYRITPEFLRTFGFRP